MTGPDNLDDWLKVLETRHPSTIDLGLERVGEVWHNLGKPRPAPRVITVAGTNGKGSTVAYIDAMLQALSWRSGCYTSPHVFRYNERLRIGHDEVGDDDLVWAFNIVEQARGHIGLTYFEHGTLAAFILLQRAELDFAVLEVGLGGRLDAVNLIDADCAVITPIGLDHQEYLGPDRECIGREKAGILRSGYPLVCTETAPPASVLQAAAELGVPVQRLGVDFFIERQQQGLLWRRQSQEIRLPEPPLMGPHQYNNLAASLAAVLTLLPAAFAKPQLLAKGIASVQLRGRLQAHPADKRVLIDVGHNPLAAEVVRQTLQTAGKRIKVCILAMLRDKDAGEVVRILDGLVDQWYCAGLQGERARSGAALAESVATFTSEQKLRHFETVSEALVKAADSTGSSDQLLVFGSFHTAAQALETILTKIRADSADP